MGRKGNWFSSVKKAFSPDSKKKEDQKSSKSKKKWFGKKKLEISSDSYVGSADKTERPPAPLPEEIKSYNVENEASQSHVHEVSTSVESERPIPVVQTPVVTIQAPKISRFAGKSREEVAAINIQTAFRGYLARRALRALRGLVRLRTLMEGPIVKRQATSTLRSMQALARVQSQIRSRRIRMFEENQALQRHLLHKHAKELESIRIEEEWDDSLQSKEQIEAKLLQKYEAAMRREKALAYAFTHQQTWKNSSRSINPMFMDPTNPSWGWSWLERWMAARTLEKEMNDDRSSVRSCSRSITGGGGGISKSYARYQLNFEKQQSPTASQINDSPSFRSYSTPSKRASRKLKKASPKNSIAMDDDVRSSASVQSGRFRRHSIGGTSVGGTSVRDDESLASSPAIPSYMTATQSAKAKSRTQSPLVAENSTPQKVRDKGSFGTVKKRLSYPLSPARPRRLSGGPPKVENNLNAEITMLNGGAA